tara:strand:- start:869 stop:1987 length:1119 start_codon:yes stop_codon:yes gene_type:complete
MATISNATLKLWVYQGDFGADKPITPTYTLYKEKASSENTIVFEISELVKDFIIVSFTGDFSSIKQTAWAEWEITRVFDDASTDTIKESAIAFNGYGYFEDGINPELSKGLLQSNTIVYHKSGDDFYLPIYSAANGAYEVKYYEGASVSQTVNYGSVCKPISIDMTTEGMDDTSNYTLDKTEICDSSSDNIVTTSVVTSSPTKVEVTDTAGNVTTVTVNHIEECLNTPYRCSFINKFGAIQNLYFFKRRDESVDISKEEYTSNTIATPTATELAEAISPSSVSYSKNKPVNKIFNVKAKKKLKLNTGYVDESFNEVMQQLMLSEQAWILEDGEVYPINPVTSSMQYKTRLWDRLVDYQMDFEYAYDEINQIR